MAGTIPDELLLSRIRKEAAAREAAIAALQAALDEATAETQEKIIAAASRLSAQINNRQVNASAIAGVILRTQVEEGFAMAEQVTALEAKVTDLENTSAASITEIRTVVATQVESMAQQTLTLRAQFNSSLATVVDQITVVSNANSALATRTTSLEATVNNPTTGVAASYARILAEETARATADTALATRTTTLESQVQTPTTGLLARVTTVESTKVDASGAYAQANSAITASLTSSSAGTIGAAINTEASARATADGNLSGKYSLKVIAGNVVTGMNITSSTGGGTDVSDVTFQASSFKVYNGSTGVAPFQVVGSQVRITGSLVLQQADIPAIDWASQITGTGKPANNADVTLTAINGGLTITSGGLTLNGTPSIKSSNYSAGSAGWAINGDGSVEFSSGTFRSTIDVGTGDARFYKPAAGAATFGNTSSGHIAMENYTIGTASLRAKYGANTKVDIRAQPVGGDVVGTIYVYNADSSTFFQIAGSITAGGSAKLVWNGDTYLYRHTAGVLKTDGDFVFRGCQLTQQYAKTDVFTTSGGVAEETFNVNISGYGFTAKPTAGFCECASDRNYKARYDWDAAGNSSTNAVVKVSRFDGTNTGAGNLRFSLVFFQ